MEKQINKYIMSGKKWMIIIQNALCMHKWILINFMPRLLVTIR